MESARGRCGPSVRKLLTTSNTTSNPAAMPPLSQARSASRKETMRSFVNDCKSPVSVDATGNSSDRRIATVTLLLSMKETTVMMPITIRIHTLAMGDAIGKPALLTSIGLRETLLEALDYDEARVNYVCRQVEETGTYELCDQSSDSTYKIEKILHA